MYVPKYFEPPSVESVREFIDKHSFAILVGGHDGKLLATHIPLLLHVTEDEEYLEGHIARGNQQQSMFKAGLPMMAIFREQHSYVSSSWYNHINVPTWNYIAVHITGTASVIEGEDLHQSIERLVSKYEPADRSGFYLEQMPKEMLEREMKGIVGFRLSIDKLEAAFKLSQNRDDEDYNSIIQQLQIAEDPMSRLIADEMKKLRKT